MRRFLIFCTLAALLACNDDNEKCRQDDVRFDRTVLVYIMGENGLHNYIASELAEMREGSKGLDGNALVVYVDNANSQQLPYIMRIKEGVTTDSVALDTDPISASPETMSKILNYASTHYPAKEYGLVLWGHASGWVIEDSVAVAPGRRQAYGLDNGKNQQTDTGLWLNMPTLSQVLKDWGQPLRFIFADCCQFQCIESAYELRNNTDYIIGSPAEIPAVGAPYSTLTKALFNPTDTFYQDIVDCYYKQVIDGYRTPLSVIKTEQLENLADATRSALLSMDEEAMADPDLDGLIYYRGNIHARKENVMYDMNDFMLQYASNSDYELWKRYLEKVVVYKTYAHSWITNYQVSFTAFDMTEERYSGISMFIPQQRSGSNYTEWLNYNENIRKMAWYWAAGLHEIGW